MLAMAALEVLSAVAPDVRPFNLTEYTYYLFDRIGSGRDRG